MQLRRSLRALAPLLAGLAVASCALSPAEESVADDGEPFSTTPFEPVHEAITAEALGFLRPEVLVALQTANVSTDIEFHFDARYHFDDCDFSGGSAVVAERQAAAVEALGGAPLEGDAAAILAFGQSLHAVQDFYSHTNWVELGLDGLVDESLAPFPQLSPYARLAPSGVRLIEGEPPKHANVWRDRDAAYPESAVAYYKLKGRRELALFSGSVDYEPGDKCPKSIEMTHDELNKDKSGEGRDALHLAAKALAVEQTRHEWCRLVTLTRARWGEAGELRLLAWVTDPAAAPVCGDAVP